MPRGQEVHPLLFDLTEGLLTSPCTFGAVRAVLTLTCPTTPPEGDRTARLR